MRFMHCQYSQEADQTYQAKPAAIKYCITLHNQKEKIALKIEVLQKKNR